jgi:hypothetical protein
MHEKKRRLDTAAKQLADLVEANLENLTRLHI